MMSTHGMNSYSTLKRKETTITPPPNQPPKKRRFILDDEEEELGDYDVNVGLEEAVRGQDDGNLSEEIEALFRDDEWDDEGGKRETLLNMEEEDKVRRLVNNLAGEFGEVANVQEEVVEEAVDNRDGEGLDRGEEVVAKQVVVNRSDGGEPVGGEEEIIEVVDNQAGERVRDGKEEEEVVVRFERSEGEHQSKFLHDVSAESSEPPTEFMDEYLALMCLRHKAYPRHYDSSDLILDLAFLNNLCKLYNATEEEAKDFNVSLDRWFAQYQLEDIFLDYARGKFPFPGGRKWEGVKRIFAVFNIDSMHYVTCVFLLEEAKINIYDCNIGVYNEDRFYSIMGPVMYMFPLYIRQSGKFNHLPPEILNLEMWSYERTQGLPRNLTGTAPHYVL